MMEMHIADNILQDVSDEKIADIFAEPDKTKVLLQLKELELIRISEVGVSITEEGGIALEKGIKSYFAYKRTTNPIPEPQKEKIERKTDALSLLGVVIAIPATLLLLLLFLTLFMMNLEQ